MTRNMTQGNLVKTLIAFSVPLILSGMLQQLYGWADGYIVGNVEGELSLAAVGSTMAVSNLFVLTMTGLTLGVSLLSARRFGEGRTEDLRDILSTFLLVLGGLYLVLGLLGSALAGPLLALLGTRADMFAMASSYLCIVLLGVPFLAVYNVYAALLRGMGDSRAPFLAVLASSAANVALDILLVALLHWHLEGAAIATALSQVLMALYISFYTWRKYPTLHFVPGRKAIHRGCLREGLALGLPSALQSSLHSTGNAVLQSFMNGFSSQTVAAITTAYRIDTVVLLPIINLSAGISTATAQNMGAGNRPRARKALWVGTAMMTAASLALILLVITLGRPLVAMFGITPEAVDIGAEFFASIAKFYIIYGLVMALRGYLEGLGDVLFSSIAATLSLGSRIALSYAMKPFLGAATIACAEGCAWCILLVLYLLRFFWKERKERPSPGRRSLS